MPGSEDPSPSSPGSFSASQSPSRPRSSTEPGPSRSPNQNDTPSPRSASTPYGSSSNYPSLDNFVLLNPPQPSAGSQFVPTLRPPHATTTPTHFPGINPYAVLLDVNSLPPQFQQGMWPLLPPQSPAYNTPHSGGPHGLPNPPFQEQFVYPAYGAGPSRLSAAPYSPGVPSSPISSPTADQAPMNTEDAAILEDKRRRNTAASARFRIKKKQKSSELERAVSDLSTRADELEREASDLRRENAWLKEIVIMKGRGNRAERQGSRAHASSSKSDEDNEPSSSNSESFDRKLKSKDKGKGKLKEGKGKGKAKETDRDGQGNKGKKS